MIETHPNLPARRIGLTGGIGSGKSEVARILSSLGAKVIDADQISKRLTQTGGEAIPAIRRQFGRAYVTPDGALNRESMRQLVFSTPEAKAELEAILHPLIRSSIEREAAAAPAHQRLVLDIPLLTEASAKDYQLDRILVVDCDPETQIARVMQRSHWTRELIEQVMAQQVPRQQRLAFADDVIVNEGISLDELRKQVEALSESWSSQV